MPAIYVLPSAVPPALASLEFAPRGLTRPVPKDQGEQRVLAIATTAPVSVTVRWRLTQTEFDAFWDWYEDVLIAGEQAFDLQLERQGGPGAGGNPRLEWWTALFAEPPSYTASSGLRYQVEAELLLIGEPFDVRTAPGLLASGADLDRGGAIFIAATARASGTDADTGAWFEPLAPVAGTDTDTGGAFMGNNLGEDLPLMLVWMGLAWTPPLVDDDDEALTAELMGL